MLGKARLTAFAATAWPARSAGYRACAVAFLGAIASLAAPRAGPAQNPANQATVTLRGVVTDSSGTPVPMARVLAGDGPATLTDSLGRFRVARFGSRPFLATVTRIGYAPVRVRIEAAPDSVYDLSIVLVALPLSLDPVDVTARDEDLARDGFYDRMRYFASGTFITPAQVERARPEYVSQLLQTVPGVRISFESAAAIPYARGCRMAVWLNGQRTDEVYGTPIGNSSVRSPDLGIDALILARRVKAIEVYARGETPVEFTSLQNPLRPTCGALVIWTKTPRP